MGQIATPLCVVDECDGATEAVAFDDAEVVLGPGEVRDVAQVVWLDVLEVLDAFDAEFVAEQGHAMRELEPDEELLEAGVFMRGVRHADADLKCRTHGVNRERSEKLRQEEVACVQEEVDRRVGVRVVHGYGLDVRHDERVVVLGVFGVFRVERSLVDKPAYDADVGGKIRGTRLEAELYVVVHFFEEHDEFEVDVRERLAQGGHEVHDCVAVVYRDVCLVLHFVFSVESKLRRDKIN